MILAHSIVGITAGNYFGNFWFLFLGSVLPDLDHLFVMARYELFSFAKIIDSIRFEKKYNIHYKTKLGHSVLGAILSSLIVLLFFGREASLYFFLAYLFHLILDWVDLDEKYYLFPINIKFKGFLPIFSKSEIIFTIFLFVIMTSSFLW